MFQTDQPTAATSLPTPAAAGTQGYFTPGNPAAGLPATILDADFMNMLMMELTNVVAAGGLTPSKTTYTQVRDAIKAYVGPGRLLNIQTFTATGAFTYTPTPGATSAIADVQGAGGQGGGSPVCGSGFNGFGAGAHSGARVVVRFSLSGVTTIAGTVGVGGNTGAAGASGQTGGTSSLGTLASCPGGAGGSVFGPIVGPAIGGNSSALPLPSIGTVLQTLFYQSGNSGTPGQLMAVGTGISGTGGISPGYGGGLTGNVGAGTGNPGTQVGQGGCGSFTPASGSAYAGGAGIRGQVTIYEYA